MNMVFASERARLLEQLSDRVLRHFPSTAWRSLFLGEAQEAVRFEQRLQTMLVAEVPDSSWDPAHFDLLAQRFGGHCEPGPGMAVVMAFAQPVMALRTAFVLQKLAGGPGVRAALRTAPAHLAHCEIEGRPWVLTVGPQVEQAEQLARRAGPRAIALCPDSQALLAERIARDLREALVVTELEDDTVLGASIILPPPRSAASSTFAGLGRV